MRGCLAAVGAICCVAIACSGSAAGSVFTWGSNAEDALGIGSATSRDLPAQLSGLSDVTAVSVGEHHALALLADGSVLAWGDNEDGELGDGNTETSAAPLEVPGLTNVVAVSAGGKSSYALLADGTVLAWGSNSSGQLGNGTTANQTHPVEVVGLEHVTAISGGHDDAIALLANGRLMAWGDGEHGQLGDGQFQNNPEPVFVNGLEHVSMISAGAGHNLALVGGELWSWGFNEFGELGDGGEANNAEPMPVEDLPDTVTEASAGNEFSLATLDDGTVWAWGRNEFGELGNGKSGKGVRSDLPVQVTGITDADSVEAGSYTGYAVLTSGAVASWGGNEFGELGSGTRGKGSLAVTRQMVCNLGQVTSISAADLSAAAVGVEEPSCLGISEVTPSQGRSAGGTEVVIHGGDFHDVTAVKFGGRPATSFAVQNSEEITAVSPPGIGEVDITVEAGGIASTATESDNYRYESHGSPEITKISPTKGSGIGGTSVTITGRGFTEVIAVSFGSQDATQYTVQSESSITAIAPAGEGKVNVVVTADGSLSSAKGNRARYTYEPAITSMAPASGSKVGGTPIEIHGIGFSTSGTAFLFGKAPASDVSCSSVTLCTAVTPPAEKDAAVEVTAKVGTAKSVKEPERPGDVFTYAG